MFCPECRCEYRAGFHECADCHVALVEQLPPLPEPPATPPEVRKWELNRADSLNIAFVKGALIGMACGQLLAAAASEMLGRFIFQPSFSPNPNPWWLDVAAPLVPMLSPLGIIIGGFIGRNYRL
jgi:hypothetical protein